MSAAGAGREGSQLLPLLPLLPLLAFSGEKAPPPLMKRHG